MRHLVWIILVGLAVVLCVAACLGVRAWAKAVPPLSLDGYRDEKLVEGPHDSAGLTEINGGCYVCHANYRTESLVQSHAKEKVGCIQCHGQSLAHQVDEFHRTPPERMYRAHDVDRMCAECHKEHDVPARKVIERWQKRCPAKTNPQEIVCTDCHFEHRLRSRTVVWDKKTGKPVVRKKGQDANHGKSESRGRVRAGLLRLGAHGTGWRSSAPGSGSGIRPAWRAKSRRGRF